MNKKDKYVLKTIEWAKKTGYESIKANLEGYETPSQFQRAQDEVTFTPDITAVKGNKKCYFEVVMKDLEENSGVSKLRLLSELAKMKGGELFVMAPTGHMRFTRDLVETRNIQATVMRI
jgi:hypothetical protein